MISATELRDRLDNLISTFGDLPMQVAVRTGPTTTRLLALADIAYQEQAGMHGPRRTDLVLETETLRATIHPEKRTR